MPKVYGSRKDRQAQKIINVLSRAAKGKQKDLATCWGISQPAVSHRINTGAVTMIEMWEARQILGIERGEISDLIGERVQND